MRKQLLTLVLIASTYFLGIAQSQFLDSLYNNYQTQPDETRFRTLYRYCYHVIPFDVPKAEQLMNQARIDLPKSTLPKTKQAFLNGLFAEVEAMIAENKNDHAASLEAFRKCFHFAEQCEEKDKFILQGTAYWGQGAQFGQQGFYEKSTNELMKAHAAFTKAKEPNKQADILSQISQNYHQLQKFDSAIICLDKALLLIDPKIDVTNQYYYNFFKANAFNRMGKPDSTIALLDLNYLNQAKPVSPILFAHLSFALADALGKKKLIPQARKIIDQAKPEVEASNHHQLRHNLLLTSAKLEKEAENHEAAYEAISDLKIFEDSMYRANMDAKFLDLQSKYDAQGKDFEIQSLESENRHQRSIMWIGGIFTISLLGSLFFWFKNLEEKRKAVQDKHNQQIRLTLQYELQEIEDDFLKNLTQYINDNMDNQNLSVEDLVRHAGINRRALNKKLKAMTNKTAAKLIREVRLQKAKKLLLQNGRNVSEVAFEVGFKDPNYFSVCFREQFGMTPTEVLKKARIH